MRKGSLFFLCLLGTSPLGLGGCDRGAQARPTTVPGATTAPHAATTPGRSQNAADCASVPTPMDASRLAGPYPSMAALCEALLDADCEVRNPIVAWGEGRDARVLDSVEAESAVMALRVGRQWYGSKSFRAPDETVGVVQAGLPGAAWPEAPALLALNLRLSREAGETAFSRTTGFLCGLGASGAPACAEVPLAWQRGDAPPTRVRVHRCDDGSLLLVSDGLRLSGEAAQAAERSLGHRVLRLP
ncbi:MAG: hypothetical protein RIT45_2371 [Pseudomonadota bacterium]